MLYITCLLIGNRGVGKTTFLYRHTHKEFPRTANDLDTFNTYGGTPGKDIKLGSKWVNIGFLELPCANEFNSLRSRFHIFANVYLLFFSMVDRESFECVRTKWIKEIEQNCNPETPIILVGTKLDLSNDDNVMNQMGGRSNASVSYQEGCHMAREIGAKCYMQCSAKEGVGVREIIVAACRATLNNVEKNNNKCVIV